MTTPAAPTTQAGQRILDEWLRLRPDHPPNTAKVRDMIVECEAEARDTAHREADYEDADGNDLGGLAAPPQPSAPQVLAGGGCTCHPAAPPQPSAPQALDVGRLATANHIMHGHIEPDRLTPCQRCQLIGRDLIDVLSRLPSEDKPEPCRQCEEDPDGPPHNPSARCESGRYSHCSCDFCF